MPYYVVNAGLGRSTHIMKSRSASTPNPLSPGSVAAQLLWFGGNSKDTLCGSSGDPLRGRVHARGGKLPGMLMAVPDSHGAASDRRQ